MQNFFNMQKFDNSTAQVNFLNDLKKNLKNFMTIFSSNIFD